MSENISSKKWVFCLLFVIVGAIFIITNPSEEQHIKAMYLQVQSEIPLLGPIALGLVDTLGMYNYRSYIFFSIVWEKMSDRPITLGILGNVILKSSSGKPAVRR